MTAAVSPDRTETREPRAASSRRSAPSERPESAAAGSSARSRARSSARSTAASTAKSTGSSSTEGSTGQPSAAPQEGGTAALSPGQRLAKVANDLLVAAVDKLAGAAADKVDDLVAKFDEIKAQGGVGLNAMISAGMAKLQGQNPVWAAIKGAVSSMSTSTKVVVALLLILTAVLSPVVLLVVALALLVAAIVGAFSSSS